MKKLILTALFFLSTNILASEVELMDDQLSAVASIFQLEKGAMLHASGYLTVYEFKTEASVEVIKSTIQQIAKKKSSSFEGVTFEETNQETLGRISEISMGPGWPAELNEELVGGLTTLIEKFLKSWQAYQTLPLAETVFSGHFVDADFSNEFFAIYDSKSKQLLVVSVRAD